MNPSLVLNQPKNPVPVLCSVIITALLLLGKGPFVFLVCLIDNPSIYHNSPIHVGGLSSPFPMFFCLAFPIAQDSHFPSEPLVTVIPK